MKKIAVKFPTLRPAHLLLMPLTLLVVSCSTFAPQAPFPTALPSAEPIESVSLSTAVPGTTAPTIAPLPEEVLQVLDAEEQLLTSLYQRVNPAVVNIDVSRQVGGTGFVDVGSGSGFVIDGAGHIVTNQHVVDGADEVRVIFSDGQIATATVLGEDPFADVAVVQVDVSVNNINPVEMGNSDDLLVGQRVIAIGNPFGLTGSMTVGIVSALGRTLPSNQTNSDGPGFSNPEVIQTDAAINPGNSGGPLLNSQGQVVGINTAIRSDSGANSGVGFAVPVNTVLRSVNQIVATGTVSYSYLGISADGFFELAEVAERAGFNVTDGVLITDVTANSPAARAGLRGGNRSLTIRGREVRVGGDIITAIDGTPLRDFPELLSYLVANTEVDQEIVVTIVRDGEFFDVPVTLGPRPS